MNSKFPFSRQHDTRWSLRILRHEIQQLEREQAHLYAKCSERVLTDWELERMDEIFQELAHFSKQAEAIAGGYSKAA
jgi:hypothetical protein